MEKLKRAIIMEKLKRAIIKEEFVALTGDYISAIILNQFLYWSDRVRDFDKLVKEEKEIAEKEGKELNVKPKNGWIYKKSSELIEETMLGMPVQTMTKHIKKLVSRGYLIDRNDVDTEFKWGLTKEYKVNRQKIIQDLKDFGYSMVEDEINLELKEEEK